MALEWELRQDAAHPLSVVAHPADGYALQSHKALQYFAALAPCQILPHLPPTHLNTQEMQCHSLLVNIPVSFAATYLDNT